MTRLGRGRSGSASGFHRGAVGTALALALASAAAAPPHAPANVSPAAGAVDVGAAPQLCAQVSDPAGLPLDVRFFARDLGADPREPFTIVALPDTQYYAETYPGIFLSQARWIVENRRTLNIVFVTHLGDIVQIGANRFEWDNAEAAMGLLDDPALTELEEGIPYGLAVGNHDQAPSNRAADNGDGNATTVLFNEYFGPDRFAGRSYYGGHFAENNDNSYQLFGAGGMDFIVFHHEFDDTHRELLDQVLAWTDALLREHRDRKAIVVSHSLMCTGTNCPRTLFAEFSNQGQLTYDALKGHRNLGLMICGHAGASYQQPRRSDTRDGHTIHTFMANYQRGEDCPFRCGNGWLRILRFAPQDDEIHVQTHSPWLETYRSDPCLDGNSCHDFVLPYDMHGGIPFDVVGSLDAVPSGSTACVPWTGRQGGGSYEWYVDVDNGADWTTGPRWTFDSTGRCDGSADCEDGDSCTADACDGGTCARTLLTSCCHVDSECDDGNWCSDDSCLLGTCVSSYNTRTCSDGDACTTDDACSAGSCVGVPLVCDDGNACTTDRCAEAGCLADYMPSPACCIAAADCDDGDPCTLDSCESGGGCLNLPAPDCCNADADCDDGDACTADRCRRNVAALAFDGANDHVSMGAVGFLGKPSGLDLERFTLECWFRWDGTGEPVATWGYRWDATDVGGVTAYPLIAKGHVDRDDWDSRNVNYFLGLDESGVLAADFEEHSTSSDPGANHPVRGTTVITPGVWHHAAATYDGSCWQLYLDGQPETDGTVCPRAIPAHDSRFQTTLATTMDENGILFGRFGGAIDEVRLWDRALTAVEVEANRLLALDRDPHLIARFSLDRALGTTMLDEAENGHLAAVHDATPAAPFGAPSHMRGTCEHRVPEDVAGMSRESYPAPRWAWNDQAGLRFDAVGGDLGALRGDGDLRGATCLASGLAAPRFADPRPDPVPGTGQYVIVRATSGCALGPWGGAGRVPGNDCS